MQVQPIQTDPLLTEAQAAEVLQTKPTTLQVWRSTGRYGLQFIKVGRLVRYRRSELERFLRDRTVGAA